MKGNYIVEFFIKPTKKIRIPGLGGLPLYNLLELYFTGIVKGALTSRAAGISFSFFMALFPFLLFMLTLIPYIPIKGFQENFIILITQMLPPNTFDAAYLVLEDITRKKYGGLLSFGFIGSIFLMTNGINAIFSSFEYSIHIQQLRSLVRQYIVSLGTSLTISFMLILTVAVTIFFQFGFDFFYQKGWILENLLWIKNFRYVLFLFLIFCTTSMLYYFGTKENKGIKFFSTGSFLTSVLSVSIFYIFRIYIIKFSNYNELYGSIGTLLILMLFIWINSIILLLGFELNASMSKLKNR